MRSQLQSLTGFDRQQSETELSQLPFATVNRWVRGDLEKLPQLGWLKSLPRGEFQVLPIENLGMSDLIMYQKSKSEVSLI